MSLFVPLSSPAVSPLLFSHSCPAPLCTLCPLLMLFLPDLSDDLHLYVFLPLSSLISAPFLPSGYTPSVPVILPAHSPAPPGGCASFLLSLSALVVSIFPLLLSQHHDALKAMVPPFILSRTLCVKCLTIVTTLLPLIQSPSAFVALQSLEIRLFNLLLYFIHLLPSRLNHFHFTIYKSLYVPIGSPSFFILLSFSISFSRSLCLLLLIPLVPVFTRMATE